MRTLRALWRLLAAVGQMLGGALICAVVFPFAGEARRMAHVGAWSRRVLRSLGVAIEAHGTPRQGGTLLVANHVSWLDILAVDAVQPVRFVSKADVRHWPLIGWMVACGGTLFIERERKRDAMRVVHQVADALKGGALVAVFPEGTTSDGAGLLPFHGNLLQSAIATETPVQPVVLRYRDADRPVSVAAAYIGETTLLQSVWAIACASGLRVRVEFLPPVGTRHLERRALAEQLRDQIGAVLERL